MALVLDSLKSSLEQGFFVAEGGSCPASAAEAADHFAGAVASWFAAAQAAGFPCATAAARRAQLAAAAAPALAAQAAPAAGAALALAVAGYMAGQLFGAGVASFPVAAGAAGAQVGAVFANLDMSNADRAQAVAGACALLAASTLVIFPAPLPPAPVI